MHARIQSPRVWKNIQHELLITGRAAIRPVDQRDMRRRLDGKVRRAVSGPVPSNGGPREGGRVVF